MIKDLFVYGALAAVLVVLSAPAWLLLLPAALAVGAVVRFRRGQRED
jgi:hypothetical protein